MRDILFRGKSLSTNNWVFGDYSSYRSCEIFDHSNQCFVDIDEDTLGEFTGLYDVNDCEIFEGDIIKAKHLKKNQPSTYTVEFVFGEFVCVHRAPDCTEYHFYDLEDIEIIGNIFDGCTEEKIF